MHKIQHSLRNIGYHDPKTGQELTQVEETLTELLADMENRLGKLEHAVKQEEPES